MKILNLVVIGGYPSPAVPSYTPFVQKFAHAIARQGVQCTVISPVAIHDGFNRRGYPFRTLEPSGKGTTVQVLRPLFLSLSARSSLARFGKFNPGLITLSCYTKAIIRTLKRFQLKPDAIYGHFLYLAGAAAVKAGNELGIPAFPCVGEGEFWTIRMFGVQRTKKDVNSAAGFLANSTVLKSLLSAEIDLPLNRIGVFPNGVNKELFYPRRKSEMRDKYGLPQNCFITSCVGNYSYKKGVSRVAESIDGLNGIKGLFLGSGVFKPVGNNVIFSNRISPSLVPEFLSASDIFVLPTLVEGSSNAIVEAMSCGLPIISSKGAFNDDLLTDEMSLRIDPINIAEIRAAILKLRDDNILRKKMGKAALEHSQQFDINIRARRILDFMEEKG